MIENLIAPSLRAMLESAPDGVLVISDRAVIVWANAQAGRMFGYAIGDLIGQPIEILVPDDLRQAHQGHREKFFASPAARPMGKGIRLTGRRSDGLEFRVDIDLTPLQTLPGTYVICLVRDLSRYLRP